MSKNNEKIEAAIMISSLLDTIGFYNGNWEFNYNLSAVNISKAITINFTIVNHYMALGGFHNLDITNWKSSDDTILLMATLKSLLNGGREINFINSYIDVYDELIKDERKSGNQTIKSISYLKKIIQNKKSSYLNLLPFENTMGGNGAAIRTGPIGIFYHDNLDKIISISITASRLTHNIPMGYLGGLISALFASYAFNGIQSWEWINCLLELVESKKITYYINSTNIGNYHNKQIDEYFLLWYKYKETRYNDILYYRGKSIFIFPKERLESLSEYIPKLFFNKNNNDKDNNERWGALGASGLDSVIFAYDALLMSIVPNEKFQLDFKNPIYNPETFVFYSALHVGDSDSTGAIAGFWYGSLLGYGGFNNSKINKLEFFKELKKLSNCLINKIN